MAEFGRGDAADRLPKFVTGGAGDPPASGTLDCQNRLLMKIKISFCVQLPVMQPDSMLRNSASTGQVRSKAASRTATRRMHA
jgi:hypothetical protein